MSSPGEPSAPRANCYRCFKPRSMCVCPLITPVDNRTGVILLQHPRERAHPIGTARFVELGMQNAAVHLAEFVGGVPVVALSPPAGTGLLYPSEHAVTLDHTMKAAPTNLVAIDGTWSHARKIYKSNPWLRALPHYRIDPSAPSNYRIRREPSPSHLSTLESVLAALRVLEPETTGLDGLQRAFEVMVDRQIACQSKPGGGRVHNAPRKRAYRRIPRWLAEEFDRAVVVYAEALPETAPCRAPRSHRELLQLVAVRVRTGEVFERFVQPRETQLDDTSLAPLGLTTEHFVDAIPPDAVAAALGAFMDDHEQLVAWNRTAPSLMHDATGVRYGVKLLKPVLAASDLDVRGRLDELAHHAPAAKPPPNTSVQGRAHARLENALRVAHWLREQARR